MANIKTFVLAVLIMMVAVPIAYAAAPGKLLITDLDVKVGSRKSSNLDDGDTISKEAAPGDKVEFDIEFFNNYTDAEDLDIEDIEVTVTIEGIDDDDDMDEEAEISRIRSNDDKSTSVEFELPIELEDGNFDVTIEAEGDDENNTAQTVIWTVSLEVEKEDDELRLYRNSLSPSETECGRTVTWNVGVINTGNDDQEDIVISLSNTELEYSESVTIDELTADPYEDDSKYNNGFKILVPTDITAGVYPMDVKVEYDNGAEIIDESVDLTVTECISELEASVVDFESCSDAGFEVTDTDPKVCVTPEGDLYTQEEQEEDDDVVVVTTPEGTVSSGTTTPVVTEPVVTEPATEEKSFFESGWFIGLLIALELLIVVGAVFLVMALMKKKKE